jgi:hypothetical protein
MFKPTVDNLYHLMKDRTVKPSMYDKRLYPHRVNLSQQLIFWTILNNQKDFEIQKVNSTYTLKLSHYAYSALNPVGEVKQCYFKVNKYASRNSNKFVPFIV